MNVVARVCLLTDAETISLGICLVALNTQLSMALAFKDKMSLGNNRTSVMQAWGRGMRPLNCLNSIPLHSMGPESEHS